MLDRFTSKIPRQLRLIAIFVTIFALAYLIWRLTASMATTLPQKFSQSETKASAIAEEIVKLTANSENNLSEVNKLDNEKRYAEALKIVDNELVNNNLAREKAVELSSELGKMTESIPSISISKKRELALQAVNSEISLINRLIAYNDYLTQLLEILRYKFTSPDADTNGKVAELVGKINLEVDAINKLNKQFKEAISGLK